MSQKETLKTFSAKKDIKSNSGSKPTSSCETWKVIQPTTIDHVTSSNTIVLVMITNSIQLEEQIAQMVKQNEVLTKTMNKKDAQIGLLMGKIKSMQESSQMVVDPSTRFSLKENPYHGSESSKAQELLMNLQVSPK